MFGEKSHDVRSGRNAGLVNLGHSQAPDPNARQFQLLHVVMEGSFWLDKIAIVNR